ncbi:11760_t:CDS:1, partial [Gigaspora margarita]
FEAVSKCLQRKLYGTHSSQKPKAKLAHPQSLESSLEETDIAGLALD